MNQDYVYILVSERKSINSSYVRVKGNQEKILVTKEKMTNFNDS